MSNWAGTAPTPAAATPALSTSLEKGIIRQGHKTSDSADGGASARGAVTIAVRGNYEEVEEKAVLQNYICGLK